MQYPSPPDRRIQKKEQTDVCILVYWETRKCFQSLVPWTYTWIGLDVCFTLWNGLHQKYSYNGITYQKTGRINIPIGYLVVIVMIRFHHHSKKKVPISVETHNLQIIFWYGVLVTSNLLTTVDCWAYGLGFPAYSNYLPDRTIVRRLTIDVDVLYSEVSGWILRKI